MASTRKRCARTKAAAVVFVAAFALVSFVPFLIMGTGLLDIKLPTIRQFDEATGYLRKLNNEIGGGNVHAGNDVRSAVSTGRAAASPPLSKETPPPHVAKDFFYLNCPQNVEFPPGTYRVSLVYHVDVINNWEDILRDQMHTVVTCGLGNRADSFDVLVSPRGGTKDIDTVAAVLKEYSGFVAAAPQLFNVNKGGGAAARNVGRIEETCRRQQASSVNGGNETIVFYFRNSGALTYHPDWREHKSITDEGPYSRSLYWRKYAEWFTLERPQRCIQQILEGAWSCGVTVKNYDSETTASGGGEVKVHQQQELKYTPSDIWAASCNHLLTRAIPNGHVSPDDGALSLGTGVKGIVLTHHSQQHRTVKDPTKQLIYPEEYDRTASRFRLMCPNYPFPEGKYKVAMGYHVGMLNNWKEVVSDQLKTLATCGLGKKASTFLLSYSNGDPKEILNLVSKYDIDAKPRLINATKSPWECPMNTALRDFCTTVTEPTVVFYFHNKGVSRYFDEWRSKMDLRKTYAKSLYWRKLIEFFLIERPTLCVNKILNGAVTCGLGIRGHHQSGNMWVASCEYLAKQPACDGESYIDSEHWLQKGMGRDNPQEMPDKYAQMWKPRKIEGSANVQLLNLYQHLALPEEYANESLLDRSMLRMHEINPI